jgi:hypothetical protein
MRSLLPGAPQGHTVLDGCAPATAGGVARGRRERSACGPSPCRGSYSLRAIPCRMFAFRSRFFAVFLRCLPVFSFRRVQPKQIKEIKDFLLTARRKDASSVKIKKAPNMTKFKVSPVFSIVVVCGPRCSRHTGLLEGRGTRLVVARGLDGGRAQGSGGGGRGRTIGCAGAGVTSQPIASRCVALRHGA